MGLSKSEAWKEKARKSWTPKRRAAARRRMLGNKISSTRKHKRQLAARNRSPEQIAATKAALTGRPKSEPHRRSLSIALTKVLIRRRKPGYRHKPNYTSKVIVEWYDAKMKTQRGVCAICAGLNGAQRLCIDHDHVTEQRRGLLCTRCNSALERVESISAWGTLALAYLQQYR